MIVSVCRFVIENETYNTTLPLLLTIQKWKRNKVVLEYIKKICKNGIYKRQERKREVKGEKGSY